MTKLSAAFKSAYTQLNPEQKDAVDCLDGPVLVLAGPGTGKTQLLTTRVGHILSQTDARAENILCLTFSDSAVSAMKQRLANLIGPDYYNISVFTYHAFGKKLFDDYPELFLDHPDDQPADDLEIDKLLRKAQSDLPYTNRLKPDYFIDDLKGLLSALKRAMITPDLLQTVCTANEAFVKAAEPIVNDALAGMPRVSMKYLSAFESVLANSDGLPDASIDPVLALKALWQDELSLALEEARSSAKPYALTKWKERWLAKSGSGWTVLDKRMLLRQRDFIALYEGYTQQLKRAGRYDYDDMILLALKGLEANENIKLELQERYQYVQLDEFQDTNKAQLQLVEQLLDNSVNENRPNVLAVGDDDQAIYSFQGAHYSNIEHFYNVYDKVKLVALKTNYRSTPGIIELSGKVRAQIDSSLSLAPKAQNSVKVSTTEDIQRVELPLDTEALAWTAQSISALIKRGSDPNSIAVLAPKHDLLGDLIPYLHAENIALSYERRDNVLENPKLNELLTAAELALRIDEPQRADTLWPIVLSFEYWQLPTTTIWELSWKAKDNHQNWTDLLLQNKATRNLALFFIRLNQICPYTDFEQLLNYLIGTLELNLNEPQAPSYCSPFFNYYLGSLSSSQTELNTDAWKLLGHIAILRAKAKSSQTNDLNLEQFMNFCSGYKDAGLKIVDSTPFREAQTAVNLMTTYSAKGQEYESVYLIDLVDSVWGKTGRGRTSMLSLPPNLGFIRLERNSSDEKLRLLFVSLSRAKQRLVMSSYLETLAGRKAEPLGFLGEHSADGKLVSPLLPSGSQTIIKPPVNSVTLNVSSLVWFDRHLDNFSAEKRALLQGRLDNFSLSPTSLSAYTNVMKGGPKQFFIDQILRFPTTQSLSATYGSAIHNAIDWQFKQAQSSAGAAPKLNQILAEFQRELAKKRLSEGDLAQLSKRGEDALSAYFKHLPIAFSAQDQSEVSLAALSGKARMIGKIDRLLVDKRGRTLTIVDFKTGKTYDRWTNEIRPLHHKRQLYFYKTLIEQSSIFKGYSVDKALLQFVEPDEDDGTIKHIELSFDESEAMEIAKLTAVVWDKIMDLDFPDTSSYSQDVKGITSFEKSLLEE